MKTIFNYRQKVFPKLLLLAVFGFVPLIIRKEQLYLSILYYALFFLLQAIVHIYYLSKRIVVSDHGIDEKLLWNVPYSATNWRNMAGASKIKIDGKSAKTSMQSMMEPFSVIRWFVEKSMGTVIKIIVTNGEPLYLDLKSIKNSPELEKLLTEKIRFVRF